MRRTRIASLGLTLGLLVLPACASSGGGGDGDGPENTYREEMGQVVYTTFVEAREKIWARHNIPLYRQEDQYRSIYFESEWMPRRPTPEEVTAGVTGARNRIVIRGRRAGATMDGVPSFSVTHEVQNQVQTETVSEWHPGPIPEAVTREYRRIYQDLMMEVRAGVRR